MKKHLIKLLEIDPKTLKETIHCDNAFECLKSENYACRIARVDSCIIETVLFINCPKRLCNYKMNYGYNYTVCNCPTRKEIYKKYKK